MQSPCLQFGNLICSLKILKARLEILKASLKILTDPKLQIENCSGKLQIEICKYQNADRKLQIENCRFKTAIREFIYISLEFVNDIIATSIAKSPQN